MKRVAAILLLMSLAPRGALAQGSGVPAAPGPGVAPAQSAAADDGQLLGMRLFNQSCRVCHAPPHAGSAQYGPVLSGNTLGGQDEALRAFIANGSPRMPGFKSHFRQEELSALVAYLRSLPPGPARGPESD
jgi:mono/diheme cytochrome c family protein